MNKTDKILDSIKEHNEPAVLDGTKGYFIQSECVFIPTENIQEAFRLYREKLYNAKIACYHNNSCPSIVRAREIKEKEIIENVFKDNRPLNNEERESVNEFFYSHFTD